MSLSLQAMEDRKRWACTERPVEILNLAKRYMQDFRRGKRARQRVVEWYIYHCAAVAHFKGLRDIDWSNRRVVEGLLEEYLTTAPGPTMDRRADYLRDLIGDPTWQYSVNSGDHHTIMLSSDSPAGIRRARLPAGWQRYGDGLVLRLAGEIRRSERWEHLPMLADALEEAGCAEDPILRHCRGQEVCWSCAGTGTILEGRDVCEMCQETGWVTGWATVRAAGSWSSCVRSCRERGVRVSERRRRHRR